MKKKEVPDISVIMGVYNQWDIEELENSVKSILNQTFRNFEFLIYDDGSEKVVSSYIKDLKKLDSRIQILGREENMGLAHSLNECIKYAKGKYIARMDADDQALPERLQVQYEFMEKHQEYAWCGCNAKLYDNRGIWGERKMPEFPIEKDYLRFSPYIHPTVMIRKDILMENDGYCVSDDTLRCEDYELFMRLYQKGYQGYNIQKFLFVYKESEDSFKKRKFCYRVREMKVRYRNFSQMHILFPFGILYVIRPVIGGLIPVGLITMMKRQETIRQESMVARENYERQRTKPVFGNLRTYHS